MLVYGCARKCLEMLALHAMLEGGHIMSDIVADWDPSKQRPQ